ncbi:LysR family transcriptional regulator [Hylemonella gracilis]|uniref:Transcriptional regulator n=1 Tax=Hylemonella gracilis ATCC 19624 TaxID=887062 RepID=F3KU64_9BURK|nr:LysR family transcriptional regulator [Hylemonella gracilis]EGI76614.1 transcriptional regulator [Hylemonella gracilis ATCC 19624]
MSTNQAQYLLNEMAVFVRVVETGSFSEAARQMAVTPSAASRAVARLEKALGQRLLQRSTRKLRLSENAQDVFEHCRDMLNAAQAALEASGRQGEEPRGTLRVSVPKAIGRALVHPHMPEFLERYPQVDVLLRLEDRYMDLYDEQIDLAIRITDQPPPGLMGRRLLRIDHLLCATPEYLAAHGVPAQPQDLKAHNCIYLGEEPSDSRWKFRRGEQSTTVQVRGRYAANNTGVRLDAVLRHLGIGSLPRFTAEQALAEGRIVTVLPDWTFQTNYSGDAWALYPRTRHVAPKLKALLDFLGERLATSR